MDKTLPFCPPIVADMIQVQLLTGARPNEVVQMRSADFDRTGEVWIFQPAENKMEHKGCERLIPVGPKAQAILGRYILKGDDKNITEKVNALLGNEDGESDQGLNVNEQQFRDLLIYALEKEKTGPRKGVLEMVNEALPKSKKLISDSNVNGAIKRVKERFGQYLNLDQTE